MTRKIELTRDEAEAITDLLMLSDDYRLSELDDTIRKAFGMASREIELDLRGVTLQEAREKIIGGFSYVHVVDVVTNAKIT